MHIPRIYIDSILEVGFKINLSANAAKHIVNVLRLKKDDQFIVFNGDGQEYMAILQEGTKSNVQALITACSISNTESPLQINIVQGVARGEKMDFIIQKATELGVQRITPIYTEYCNVNFPKERAEKRLQHWQNIAINATEQSGRCCIPKIMPLEKLVTWVAQDQPGLSLILDPQATNSLASLIKKPQNSFQVINLLIGPEGGFSPQEIILAQQYNCQSINLGKRILRTETAALVAVSILQGMLGDLN